MDSQTQTPGNTPGDALQIGESLLTSTNSFVVVIRLFTRPSNSDRGEWRGSVEHAESRERIYFVEFARMNEFIAAHSGIVLPPAGWRNRAWQAWHKTRLSRLVERWIQVNIA